MPSRIHHPPFFGPPVTGALGKDPAPAIISITPNTDRAGGGASVTIIGAYFKTGASVTFGGAAASAVVVVDAFTITCTTPAHAAGVVDVVVTNTNGTAATAANAFTYITSVIVSINPPSGINTGGTSVTITGTNFVAGSTITLDGAPFTGVVFVNDTTYTGITPAGVAGNVVDVVLTEAGGAVATLPKSFIYVSVVITPGTAAPTLDQPTSPNTTAPTGSFVESQAGIRWSPSVSIRSATGNSPNSCSYVIDGKATPPAVNTDVSFVLNGILKFAGTIIDIEATYEDYTHNLVYNVGAVDYTWQLNRFHPTGHYDKQLPSRIIRDLAQKFAPGYSVAYINEGIDLNGPISLHLDGMSDFNSVLTEVCRNAGDTHWRVDYYKNIRVFEGTDPAIPFVDSLVDGRASLWNDPPVRVSTDLSQIRNKVTAVGKGTSSIDNPLKLTNIPGTTGYDATLPNYDATGLDQLQICVTSIEGFNDIFGNGGYVLVDGLPLRYTAALPFTPSNSSAIVDDGAPDHGTPCVRIDLLNDATTFANAYKILIDQPYEAGPNISGATYKKWPNGLQVLPLVVEQDNTSIALYGIHEFMIVDSNLKTTASLTARAKADLKKFAFPLQKVEYRSTDDKSVVGAPMRADMAYPMVHGDFVLQEVTITHDEFGIRYDVVADNAAKYDLNDLLLDLDKQKIEPDLTGLVALAAKKAVDQMPVVTGQTLLSASGQLTAHQVNQLNSTPVEVLPAPGANKINVLVSAFFQSTVTTPQATTQVPQVVYTGTTTALATAPVTWNGVTNEQTDNIAPFATGTGAQTVATLIENRGLSIRAANNGNSDGVGTYRYVITYYVVSRPA